MNVSAWLAATLVSLTLSCADSASDLSDAALRLADHTAGNACVKDEECAGGMCLHMLRNTAAQRELEAPSGYCSAPCQSDSECGADGACVGVSASTKGQCLARCASAVHCRMGYQCLDAAGKRLDGIASLPRATAAGSCQALPAVSKLSGDSVGRMCESDPDCGEGFCSNVDLAFRSLPGGYCSGNCTQDSDCGETGVCAKSIPGAPGACFRGCTSDADCARSDYRCRKNVAGQGLQCLPAVKPLPDGTSGKACTNDQACGGAANSCATHSTGPAPVTYPGGYCTQTCAADADCGAGGVCAADFAVIAMGACYQSCKQSTDCRDGYACRVAPQASSAWRTPEMMASGPLVCAPALSSASDSDAGT